MSAAAAQTRISESNFRSAATLTAGSTWTGTFEPCSYFYCKQLVDFNSLSVLVKATRAANTIKIGWLYVDFSRDGVNTVRTLQFRLMDDRHVNRIFMCPIQLPGKYVRLRFKAPTIVDDRESVVYTVAGDGSTVGPFPQNIANDWTNLEIHTMFHVDTEPVHDFVIGRQVVQMTGINASTNAARMTTYNCDIVYGAYPLPTTNTQLRVNTNSFNNAGGGNNGRTFLAIGLDQNNDEVYWYSTFSGVGNSTCSAATWTRINEFYPLTFGPSGNVTSNIFIQMFISGSWRSLVFYDATECYTAAVYTVPSGYNGSKIISRRSTVSTISNNQALFLVRPLTTGGTLAQPSPIIKDFASAGNPENARYPDGIGHAGPGATYMGAMQHVGGSWCSWMVEIELS